MVHTNKVKDIITTSEIVILQNFEQQLTNQIRAILNTNDFKHLSVGIGLELEPKRNAAVRITDNSSFSVPGSISFMSKIGEYVAKQDTIEVALRNTSLHIDFTIKDKGKEPNAISNSDNNENAQNKQNEEPKKTFIAVTPKYSFEQIILPEEVRAELMSAMKVLECKDLIYSQWGFGEIEPAPKSIINMYGEPGTGKTMCAHAIAKHLGKQLLALNYAEIESKYVGEAPKNLMAAFDAAKEKDCVLFFDEADSFLGKRIQNVTSGSEQALNSLRSQMLILLEEFSGVVLFATNLVTNFDKAFESRILKHIRFELPNQEARAAIIKKHIPKNLPLLSPFTEEQYMEASLILEGFSGREIKGAILDMLLAKADINATGIVFTYEDLCTSFTKKKEEKERLKAEENRLLKEKITKKLHEKAAEAEAEKDDQEKIDAENAVEVKDEHKDEK